MTLLGKSFEPIVLSTLVLLGENLKPKEGSTLTLLGENLVLVLFYLY